MTWPRYAISQSEAQLALIISYNSYKSVNLWLKLVLVFYFKSLHRQEIDAKTGWGVNSSFGQGGGGGGGFQLILYEVRVRVRAWGRILKILPL